MDDSKVQAEQEERAIRDLTRGTWIQLIDDEGEDCGETEVLHVEVYPDAWAGFSAQLMHRPLDGRPMTVDFDAAMTVPVLTPERLAEVKAAAERAKRIADIRAFADFLERSPWAPLPYESAQAEIDVDLVSEYGERVGVKPDEHLDDRTQVFHRIGGFEYRVIAWHRDGRPVEPKPEPVAEELGLNYGRGDESGPEPVSPDPASRRAESHFEGHLSHIASDGTKDAEPKCYVPNGFQAPEVIAERVAACAASHPSTPCRSAAE